VRIVGWCWSLKVTPTQGVESVTATSLPAYLARRDCQGPEPLLFLLLQKGDQPLPGALAIAAAAFSADAQIMTFDSVYFDADVPPSYSGAGGNISASCAAGVRCSTPTVFAT